MFKIYHRVHVTLDLILLSVAYKFLLVFLMIDGLFYLYSLFIRGKIQTFVRFVVKRELRNVDFVVFFSSLVHKTELRKKLHA